MDKVVFITGASRGIGAATVKKFADNGWKVAGFYNKTQTKNYYQLDVSDPESIKKAFEQAFSDFGRVDCLVNSAGVVLNKRLNEYSEEDFEKIIGINEIGLYCCVKEVIKKMDRGTIINVGSTSAFSGNYDSVYAATKGAVHSFTKSMALELAPKIRVNSVAPGVARTDMGLIGWDPGELEERVSKIPLGVMAEPEDVANGIYFLASEEAGHITGACLDINGGYVLR